MVHPLLQVDSQTLADGSASEEPEHARAAMSSANASIYVVSAANDLQVGHATANEASHCNVVINTKNKALKTAKQDDDSPSGIPAERINASSKYSKANAVEKCSLDNNGKGEDIHGSREINALASGSPESRYKPLNGSEVLLSDSESKQPMSAHSLKSSSSMSPFKVKGKAFEEVNLDHSPVSNVNRAKNAFSRRREKRKEILKKADSDLYMNKSPKKLESPDSSVSLQGSSCFSVMQESSGSFEEDATTNQDYRNKAETDYWKNDAGISTQNLDTSSKPEVVVHHKAKHHEDGKKRYSTDFLITFSSNFTNLPADFKLASDAAENLLCSNAITPKLVKHSPKGTSPSNAQLVSRPAGISRLEYRAISVTDNVRRKKPQATVASGPEPCNGANRSANNYGIRPGQRGNYDVGRSLRVHAPMQRNSRNGNKWQCASRSVRGLISSQSPLHRAEKKYEVRKVSDVEEGKQRQLKAILNKLTPQNFERLFQQVKEVTIDNAVTLTGVIFQIFDKALMEPTFCEMYADLCYHLASELPDFVEDDQRITFKRLLLNKCQEEFERGEREQAEAEKMEGDGEFKQSDQEREEKRIQARRRMLGNIRLIGELYKNKMLTERIMHECIQKLLGDYQNPDEEDIEALCKLMCTIGEMIDHPKAKDQMDTYFEILSNLANNTDLSSRLRFMLMDVIDLRKNNWQQRRKVEGPKKLEELHRDAHQERHAHQTHRFSRAPNIPSPRRGHPPDIDNHATTMLSTSQINAVHRMPSYIHGFGGQDVRLDNKHLHESQASSLPLPHTSINDNTIYLDPWGMPASGPLVLSCSPPTDINSGFGETIIIQGAPGGYSPVSELLPYNVRQEPISRYSLESFVRPSVYDYSIQQGNVLYASRDAANLNCSYGRSSELSSSACLQTHPFAPNPTEKVFSEERLAELSISAIREFYR